MVRSTSGIAVGEISYEDGRVHALKAKPNPIEGNFVHHQGAFYRRTLFAEHGNFDAALKERDSRFGLRELSTFAAEARAAGLALAERRVMPANNLMLRFERRGD